MSVLWLVVVFVPAGASAQSFRPSFSLHAAAGPTIIDEGHTVAAAAGISPSSRVTFLVDFQRTEILPQVKRTPTSFSASRGGTMTAVSGEVRLALFPPRRFTPYALAGVGRGESRPTVNQDFPIPVENDTAFIFFGGGVHVPLWRRISAFGDFRMLIGGEGDDGLLVMYPVRFGMAVRF
jgi:hypothetical protein